MKFHKIAKAIGLEGPEFEMQEGAIALSVDHMAALEEKLTNHSEAKKEWKAEKDVIESNHKAAIDAAVANATKDSAEKLEASNKALGEVTAELSAAKAKIESLENDPADNADVLNPIGNPKGTKTEFSYSNERFKKK